MTEKYLKTCSTFLSFRKMLIKTTLRFQPNLVRMAKINKQRKARKGENLFIIAGVQTCTATVEISVAVPWGAENEPTI